MRSAKRNVKKNLAHYAKPISGWDAAITDAEKMIVEERLKIARLKRAIESFKGLRDSGHPFPSEGTKQSEAET